MVRNTLIGLVCVSLLAACGSNEPESSASSSVETSTAAGIDGMMTSTPEGFSAAGLEGTVSYDAGPPVTFTATTFSFSGSDADACDALVEWVSAIQPTVEPLLRPGTNWRTNMLGGPTVLREHPEYRADVVAGCAETLANNASGWTAVDAILAEESEEWIVSAVALHGPFTSPLTIELSSSSRAPGTVGGRTSNIVSDLDEGVVTLIVYRVPNQSS